MRFTNYIPTEKGESGNLDLPFLVDFNLTAYFLIRYGHFIKLGSAIIISKLMVGRTGKPYGQK